MRFFLFLFLAFISLSSCSYFGGERIRGNGKITSETKSTGKFSSVDVSGAIKVRLKQDSLHSVRVETDHNLMDYIDIYTSGDRLIIDTEPGFNLDPSREITVYVSAPQFKDLEVSGASDITGEGIINSSSEMSMHVSGASDIKMQVAAPRITVEVNGASNIRLKGQVTDFDASVSGAGNVRCFELISDNASLDLSGASKAEIMVNKKLDVEASGASHIRYKGAASVSERISGAGSVKKVG